jgi:hypothetical protein
MYKWGKVIVGVLKTIVDLTLEKKKIGLTLSQRYSKLNGYFCYYCFAFDTSMPNVSHDVFHYIFQ